MKNKILLLILFISGFSLGNCQEQLLTFGFQYKPIFSSRFFGAGEVESTSDIFNAKIKPVWGHNYGMIIRRGITKSISYEVGISYVKRNYLMTATDLDSGFTTESRFGIVSYEIPNQMLIYVRLGKNFYMNNAFGFAVTAFASDVESRATDKRIYQTSRMTTRFFSGSIIANVGFEYRTEKSGFFYIGASFQQPLKHIANTTAYYDKTNLLIYNTPLQLEGAYLTLDLRYFFNEDPIKKEKNKTRQQ